MIQSQQFLPPIRRHPRKHELAVSGTPRSLRFRPLPLRIRAFADDGRAAIRAFADDAVAERRA